MALSLADANRIIGASIAAADGMGIKLSVAVVDAGGRDGDQAERGGG